MGRSCTHCGETLSLWDRLKGSMDHQRCWEKNIVRPQADDPILELSLAKEGVLFRIAQIMYSAARTSR
jgi:hypothetical protein